MPSSSAPVATRSGGSNNSDWLRLYAVTGRGEEVVVTRVKVCVTLSFTDGIDKVRLRLTGCDNNRCYTIFPLHYPKLPTGAATVLDDACFSDGALEAFPTDAAAAPFTGSWLPSVGRLDAMVAQGLGSPGSAPLLQLRVDISPEANPSATGVFSMFRMVLCFAPPPPPSPPLAPPSSPYTTKAPHIF